MEKITTDMLMGDIASVAKRKAFISDEGEYISETLPELSGAIDLGNIHGQLQRKITESEEHRVACKT